MNFIRKFLLFGLFVLLPKIDAKIIFYDDSSILYIGNGGEINLQTGDKFRQVNGTVRRNPTGKISGTKMFFRDGFLSDGDFDIEFTGTYDPSMTASIRMLGPSKFSVVNPGDIPYTVLVSGTGNRLEGQPLFKNKNAIQFDGASTELILALLTELDTTMSLKSIVNLAADLILSDDVIIDGPGTINFNTFNLILGQKDLTWSHTLLMNGAKNLVLNSDNRLKGQWIFDGDAHIIGNGFILDLTGGATIRVQPNTTVRMTDLIIKGLGTGIVALNDNTSKIELHNVIFDMDGNYTETNGAWVAKGETTVVTRDKFLTFDLRGTLTIDRTTVYYNTLSFNDQNNIQFGSLTANIAQPNGGSVRKIRSLPVGDFRISENKELDRELVISPLKRLIVDQTATINGAGFDYRFARNPGETIVFIDPNVGIRFTNILLKDFPVENLSQDPTAQVIFADNATIEIGENGTLNNTWMFEGQSILNGAGKTLTLGTSGALVVRPGSSLLIDNIILKDVSGNKIRTMDTCGTVSLGNIVWKQDADYTMTQGRFDVIGLWELQGTYTFGYQSQCVSNVRTRGTIFLDIDMTFSYAPPLDNRDLIQFDDDLAFFLMRASTLASTTTGMRLTKGTFDIESHCFLTQNSSIKPAITESVSIGNGNPVEEVFPVIGPGAVLEILSGRLFYDQVE